MKKTAWISWLSIAIPIAALFGPALVSDRSFAMRDAGHFYYPLFEWCCREWAAGRVPLWNPYENVGMPVLADATSSTFYPGKLLFLLPLSFAFRFKLYVVLHVVLAAGGSYRLARAWRASQPAAALAAMAYACGGNVVFQHSNVVFLVGAAWLPIAALAADWMLRLQSWRAAVLHGAVLALMILGGDPQMAVNSLLMSAMYAVVLGWFNRRRVKSGAWWRELAVQCGLMAMAVCLAFLLAAVQILPSSEAISLSDRAAFNRPRNIYEAATVAFDRNAKQPLGESRGQSIVRGLFGEPEERSHHELAYDFSVGPWRLLEYFYPNVGGRMFPIHRRWMSLLPGEGRVWTPTLYMGLLPAILAIGAFGIRSGSVRLRWLSLSIIFFTLGSFGYYGAGWLLRELMTPLAPQSASRLGIGSPVGGVYWLFVTLLPTYAYFRYPAKLLPLVSLGISQLSARGLDRAFASRRSLVPRGLLLLGVGTGAMALVMGFLGEQVVANVAQRWLEWSSGRAQMAKIDWNDPSLGPFDATGAYHDVLMALFQAASVTLLGYWVLSQARSETVRSSQWKMLAVLLTAVDIAAANFWLVAIAPSESWNSKSPLSPPLASPPPRMYRGNLASWRPASFQTKVSRSRLDEIVQWEHATLFPKHHLANSVALVESYGSIRLADYDSLLSIAKQHGSRQADRSLLPQPTALRMLGTEFLVLPEGHQPQFADRMEAKGDQWPEGAALWKLKRTMPRAWIVHEVNILPELTSPYRAEVIDEQTEEVLFPGGRPRGFDSEATVETNDPRPEWQRNADSTDATAAEERCRIVHYDAQRVVIETELARPGLVVFSDAWYPGWRAVVTSADGSGSDTQIYRTNRVLRGIWLPDGTHTIEYRFKPRSFYWGALISGCGWLALAFGLVTQHIIRGNSFQQA